MEYKFVNESHKQTYYDAMRFLASEDERQAVEAARMYKEWERLPDDLRMERIAWLRQHFHACRQPYIKLLTDVLSLATPIIRIPVQQC